MIRFPHLKNGTKLDNGRDVSVRSHQAISCIKNVPSDIPRNNRDRSIQIFGQRVKFCSDQAEVAVFRGLEFTHFIFNSSVSTWERGRYTRDRTPWETSVPASWRAHSQITGITREFSGCPTNSRGRKYFCRSLERGRKHNATPPHRSHTRSLRRRKALSLFEIHIKPHTMPKEYPALRNKKQERGVFRASNNADG